MEKPGKIGSLSGLVGTDAPTAYRDLIMAHSNVVAITVCRYETPPLLQQRINPTVFEQEIITAALSIRGETRIPFWEAVFAACIKAGRCTDPLLDATMFHNGPGDPTRVTVGELQSQGLQRFVDSGQRNVGLASLVELENSDTHHLALMDFHCSINEENTEIVAAVCRRLMPLGFFLLDSGDSYHACGIALLTANERLEYLARSLLFAPIVDVAYVAHQLLQSMSSIRISGGGSKTKCPEVLRVEVVP